MQWSQIILVVLINAFIYVLAEKNQIIKLMERENWMSMEKLAALLKVSFSTSICCNVIISDKTVAVANIFNEFVRIYVSEYTLNSRTYNCTGYFMIFASTDSLVTAIRKVPTTIASIELLIAITDNVEESSDLFNISMYHDANVNIAAPNGLWSLSENFLEPRIMKKVLRFSEMSDKREFLDFHGRQLQASTIYFPPMCYLQSTCNKCYKGVDAAFYTESPQSELDGIEIQLFLLMAEHLNFPWKIRQCNPTQWYGEINGSTWNGGLIGQVFHKEVDIGFAAIWIVLDHTILTNLTQPWTQMYTKFLVPRPKAYRSFFALIQLFSKEVWATIFTMLIVQSIYVSTRAWIDPRIPRRFRNFIVTLTELMGQLLGVWTPARINSFRIQLYLWHLIGILLVTAYSCNLAARLTSTNYENKVDTIRQFIESNFTWGRQSIPEFHNLFDSSDPYANQLQARFKLEISEAEKHENILKGNYALLSAGIEGIYFPENDVRDEDLRGFRVMNEATSSFYVAFCVQPWLVEPLDKVLYHLRESGMVKYHIDSVLHRRTGSALRELTIENNYSGPEALTLIPLGVGFSVLIFGLSFSTAVFFLELKIFKQKSIYQLYKEK